MSSVCAPRLPKRCCDPFERPLRGINTWEYRGFYTEPKEVLQESWDFGVRILVRFTRNPEEVTCAANGCFPSWFLEERDVAEKERSMAPSKDTGWFSSGEPVEPKKCFGRSVYSHRRVRRVQRRG